MCIAMVTKCELTSASAVNKDQFVVMAKRKAGNHMSFQCSSGHSSVVENWQVKPGALGSVFNNVFNLKTDI